VTAGLFRKDSTMRSKLALIALCSAVAACNTPPLADQGLASVNVPVVTTTDYVFDAAAPDGALSPGEAARLDGWFQGLGLGYGDSVYVDGPYAAAARDQIAAVAGRYGMLVEPGAPVTAGAVPAGGVRVVVSRRRAIVNNCPNWSEPSQPNFHNRTMSNFGCGVNTNLALQVADPGDLIHGQSGDPASDAVAGAKAINLYRNWPLTGVKPGQGQRSLMEVQDSTQGGGK
jgi:pilus assembly protein CpaD